MYLFVLELRPVNEHVDPETFVDRVRALLADFRGPDAGTGTGLNPSVIPIPTP